MSIDEEIRLLMERADGGCSESVLQKANLYAEGLKSKHQETELALRQLTLLCGPEYVHVGEEDLEYHQVAFHVDAFFAFLYSCLDVLAQIINQLRQLDIDESQVSIARLGSGSLQGPLHSAVKDLLDSRTYTNLHRYRNCSLHRRHIFIQRDSVTSTCAPGYVTVTAPLSRATWLITDNPLTIRPSIRQKREIPAYLEKTLGKVDKHIQKILRVLP